MLEAMLMGVKNISVLVIEQLSHLTNLSFEKKKV